MKGVDFGREEVGREGVAGYVAGCFADRKEMAIRLLGIEQRGLSGSVKLDQGMRMNWSSVRSSSFRSV